MPQGRENMREQSTVSPDKWAETLTEFLELAGKAVKDFDYERALSYLTTMEEIWDSKGLPTYSLDLRFELLNKKGRVLTKLGRYGEAVQEYQRLLDFCRDQNLDSRRVEVFLEIGQLLAKTGELDRALGYVHRALTGYRRLHDDLGKCRSLRNLGAIYFELGEFDDAESSYEEAIEIAQQQGLQGLYADIYNNLGTVKNIRGDWKAALECYTKSQDVYEREGEVRKSAYTLNNIGITLLEQDRLKNAKGYFISALDVAERIKDESLRLILNINLTDLYLRLNDPASARNSCRNASDYLESKNLKNGQLVESKKLAGKIETAEKNYDEGLRLFREAIRIAEEIGLRYIQAEIMFEIGNLYLKKEEHMEALQSLEKAFSLFNKFKAAGKLEKTEGLIQSVEDLYLKIFEAMAFKVDQKDPYTKGHSDRVANLSLYLARHLGMSDQETKSIVAGALLHDIGKLRVPDEILNKPGKLTDEEFDEIKRHPDNGVQLLSGINLPWDVASMIRYHHEKYDGGGYPAGVSGELIPAGARVICISDVFDALTSERPYRKAFSPEKTLGIMKGDMSSSFDPVMLARFEELIKSGEVDHIINRQTDPDEMYKIWAQCRIKPIEDPEPVPVG